MSDERTEVEPLWDPIDALHLALASQGWAAAPTSAISVRLAGGRIDGKTRLVTDLRVYPGAASIDTRLNFLVPAAYRHQAALLCSSINASGITVVSLDPDGAPVVFSRLFLAAPTEVAAATIVDAIRVHRRHATMISPVFIHAARGEPAASIAAEMGLPEPIPLTAPVPVAPVLDLSQTPELSDWLRSQRRPNLTGIEWDALCRFQRLNLERPDREPCADPLMTHADGTVECYGCPSPEARFHPEGCTVSCWPERRIGIGHLCGRCDPD